MELTPEQRAQRAILGWDDQVLKGLRQLQQQTKEASQHPAGATIDRKPTLVIEDDDH